MNLTETEIEDVQARFSEAAGKSNLSSKELLKEIIEQKFGEKILLEYLSVKKALLYKEAEIAKELVGESRLDIVAAMPVLLDKYLDARGINKKEYDRIDGLIEDSLGGLDIKHISHIQDLLLDN